MEKIGIMEGLGTFKMIKPVRLHSGRIRRGGKMVHSGRV